MIVARMKKSTAGRPKYQPDGQARGLALQARNLCCSPWRSFPRLRIGLVFEEIGDRTGFPISLPQITGIGSKLTLGRHVLSARPSLAIRLTVEGGAKSGVNEANRRAVDSTTTTACAPRVFARSKPIPVGARRDPGRSKRNFLDAQVLPSPALRADF